jgi:hypothetical protein
MIRSKAPKSVVACTTDVVAFVTTPTTSSSAPSSSTALMVKADTNICNMQNSMKVFVTTYVKINNFYEMQSCPLSSTKSSMIQHHPLSTLLPSTNFPSRKDSNKAKKGDDHPVKQNINNNKTSTTYLNHGANERNDNHHFVEIIIPATTPIEEDYYYHLPVEDAIMDNDFLNEDQQHGLLHCPVNVEADDDDDDILLIHEYLLVDESSDKSSSIFQPRNLIPMI